jgi:hypothetical protein
VAGCCEDVNRILGSVPCEEIPYKDYWILKTTLLYRREIFNIVIVNFLRH